MNTTNTYNTNQYSSSLRVIQAIKHAIFNNNIIIIISKLQKVQSFKFLGSYKTATGDCTKDIKIRAALARQKATELTNIWKDRNINEVLKVKVMKQMMWAVFLHGAEWWTIKKSDKNRIEALEMWCWRKLLWVSWREHKTNKSIPTFFHGSPCNSMTELTLQRRVETVGEVALPMFGGISSPTRYRRYSLP